MTTVAARALVPAQAPIRYPKAFVVAMAAFVLVTLGRVHEVIPGLQPFRLGMVSSILTVVLAFAVFRRDLVAELMRSSVARGLVVVVLVACLTVPTAEWPRASFTFLTRVYYTPVILLLVTALTFADARALRVVLLAVAADALLAGALSLLAPFGRYEIGETYDANETGALLLMVIPWSIYILISEKGWFRWVALASIPLCLVGILKTGSRGALLSTAALVPFLLYLAPPKRRGPFIILVAIAAVVTTASVGQRTWYRLKMAFDPTEYNYTTEDGRIEIWKRGLGYVAHAPLQGVGIDGFPYKELASKTNKGFGVRQAAAHNMYLQVAAELGLIGFAGFLTMLGGALALCTRARRRARQLVASGLEAAGQRLLLQANMAQASLFSVMCTGFFLSMGYSTMVYFAVGAALGVWLSAVHESSSPGGPRPVAAPVPGRRGMRGWRSARPVPAGPGFHASDRPLA